MARNHLEKMDAPDVRRTTPIPTTCDKCGFELPDDAVTNRGYFVNQITCRDSTRNNKAFTGVPSTFLKSKDINHKYKTEGDSATGYVLRENYDFVSWHTWCEPCYSEMVRKQALSKKYNQLDLGQNFTHQTAINMMHSLVRKQSVKA